MQTKRTISLDINVIEQAKILAKKKGSSLSEMIEHYLNFMIRKEETQIEILPKIKKLQGSVKLPGNLMKNRIIK